MGKTASERITSQINTQLPNTSVLKEKSLLWDIKNEGSNLNEGNMEDSISAQFFTLPCIQALCHTIVTVPLTKGITPLFTLHLWFWLCDLIWPIGGKHWVHLEPKPEESMYVYTCLLPFCHCPEKSMSRLACWCQKEETHPGGPDPATVSQSIPVESRAFHPHPQQAHVWAQLISDDAADPQVHQLQ